jgi:Big-like domain-containing protein
MRELVRFSAQRVLIALFCVAVIACGGESKTATAPTTTTPAPQANRNPAISAMSMTAFGIQQLSTFNFSASATDPDGDPPTFAWDIAGNPASGTSGTMSFNVGGTGLARVTVTDGKGGTATDTRDFVVGSMTGRWGGTWSSFVFTSNLVQNNGGLVTGDYVDQAGPASLAQGVSNSIDINGRVTLRYKGGTFSDFTLTGQMDTTGRRITGVVNGSGANNTPFTMTK